MKKFIDLIKRLYQRIKSAIHLRHVLIAGSCVAVILVSAALAVFTVSAAIKSDTKDRVINAEEALNFEDIDCILVLGAGLQADGSPSSMLADRLKVAVSLVAGNSDTRLLLSGDNSGKHYNEVDAMRAFVMDYGVSEEQIIADGEGFSTYESVSRALYEYGVEKVIIVTQEYHLYRALYIAETMGLDAYGVPADLRPYKKPIYRNVRESLARFKDFILTVERD